MYPSTESPASGVFIEQQVQGLSSLGLEVRVMVLDRRREGSQVYYRLPAKLRTELLDFGPDVVHVMYGGVMAEQVTAQDGLPPVVVTFHGSDLLGENFSGLKRKVISRYGVFCSKKAARRAHAVIVVARHLLNKLGPGVKREKVRVIPCGIDLDRFTAMDQGSCRQRLGWQPDRFHVVFATSADDPVKRPELARAAVAEFGKQYGHIQLHVLSAVPNAEVPVWLNASDALLLTSRHEGSPTVVKESLACGLPVVSVNVGDVAERIDGIEGCFLAEAEPGDLARKLGLVQARGQRLNCRAKLQDLSCQAVAAKLEQLYKEVVRPCPNPIQSEEDHRFRSCSTFGLLSNFGSRVSDFVRK